MLTAHSDKSRLLDAYQAGVDDFVSKPFDPEELLARVRAGIRSAKVRDDLHRRAIGSQARSGELALVNSRLEQLTITDELTGLFNRRHAMSRMEEQWSLADRYNRPLTIAAIDVDHFKEINDTYGHDAGDSVLKQIAALLREKTRTSDAVCRVGGDEFLIIFPSQTVEEAAVCTDRFRMAVKAHSFKVGGRDIATSASIGLASRQPDMVQFPDLLKCADMALYEAKRAGRGVSRVADKTESQGAPGRDPVSAIPPADATIDVTARGAAVNLQAVIGRCGGDSAFAMALLDRFEKQAGAEVDKIQQALAAGDADTVHRTAHRLKSMAAYVSADKAAQLAEKIEGQGRSGNLADLGALVAELRSSVDSVIAWIAARRPASAA
jgi:diguanylate cyclase (GGDEF)-like protein